MSGTRDESRRYGIEAHVGENAEGSRCCKVRLLKATCKVQIISCTIPDEGHKSSGVDVYPAGLRLGVCAIVSCYCLVLPVCNKKVYSVFFIFVACDVGCFYRSPQLRAIVLSKY